MKKIINISLFSLLLFNVATTTPISEKGSLAIQGTGKVVGGAAILLVGGAVIWKIMNDIQNNSKGPESVVRTLGALGATALVAYMSLNGSSYFLDIGFNDLQHFRSM